MNANTLSDFAGLERAKWAFTTRRVERQDVHSLCSELDKAQPGDLILCEVMSLGQHKNIQLADRRVSAIYPGDFAVLALGDRYAPDQFHALAVIAGPTAELVAAGGVVGSVVAAHSKMARPTSLRPVGRLLDALGKAVNVAAYALPRCAMNGDVTVIGVFGASMNAGKTTAAANLAFGFRRAGYATAAIKSTGTGAFGDFLAFEDTGALTYDFTDAGMATTYRMPLPRIEEGFATLIGTCAAKGAEVVVCEIADGVFQQETRSILQASTIRDRLDAILFAAPDALSALGGVLVLEKLGLSPFAISGMVSLSPLASAEAEAATGLPILKVEELWSPALLEDIVGPLKSRKRNKLAA